MPYRVYRSGPWYRGGVPRSYVAPTVFASVGCAICLTGFSVVFIFGGGAMLGISRMQKKTESEPPFDSEFFKKHRSNIPDVVGTVGSVILGIGCTMFAIGITMCIVAGYLARKQEQRRHAEQQNPLSTAAAQPPPPSAYPHQQPSQNVYPPAGIYPPYTAGTNVTMDGQYQYPPQPADYPPPYPSAPSTGNQFPTPIYAQSVSPNLPPQDASDITKQPLAQNL